VRNEESKIHERINIDDEEEEEGKGGNDEF
jgi:hypothetical protein